jgi:uncharacterized SAM-binding protein YcdF (DUF218 family)
MQFVLLVVLLLLRFLYTLLIALLMLLLLLALLLLQTRSVRDLARLSLNRETVEYVSVADARNNDDAASSTSTITSTEGPGSTPSKYVLELTNFHQTFQL